MVLPFSPNSAETLQCRTREAIDRYDAGMLAPLLDDDDLWIKVATMLQQSRALIAPDSAQVFFLNDHDKLFDAFAFASQADAVDGLRRNGYQRFAEAPNLQAFLLPPTPPFLAEVSSIRPIRPADIGAHHPRNR